MFVSHITAACMYVCVYVCIEGLDARGDSNVFRFNTCENNLGAGVRIGGHKIDGYQYGQNNEIYHNLLEDNDHAAIKITVRALWHQENVCAAVFTAAAVVCTGLDDNGPSLPCLPRFGCVCSKHVTGRTQLGSEPRIQFKAFVNVVINTGRGKNHTHTRMVFVFKLLGLLKYPIGPRYRHALPPGLPRSKSLPMDTVPPNR